MYIDILIIIITFPYSTCISSFFGSNIPTSLFILKMFFRSCLCNFLCNFIINKILRLYAIKVHYYRLIRIISLITTYAYTSPGSSTCKVPKYME